MNGASVCCGLKTEKAVEHDLGDKNAFKKFFVQTQTTGHVAALHGAVFRILIIGAITSGSLGFFKPADDLFQPSPGIVRTFAEQSGHEVMIGKAQHGAAVLHLKAPGDAFGIRPGPVIVVDVPACGGAGAKAPMIDVSAGRGVASDGSAAGDPGTDGFGLSRCREIVIDRFVVEKGESIIMEHAIQVHGAEAAGLFIPKAPAAVVLDPLSVVAQIRWIKGFSAAGHTPLRMANDLFFQFGQIQHGVIIVDGCQRILAAERQQVPIIAADALVAADHFGPALIPGHPAAAFMARPGGVDAVSAARLEFVHHKTQGGAHAADLPAQKNKIARPQEIGNAAAQERRVVDRVAGVAGGMEGFDDHLSCA
ncbi:MAG: hypothetical protein BWY83_03198 [bacterium ADurb.Bin478]|nr:MAG: hypothetical protein BWY83_03198 [bacterium ADurb.Bin478]